MFVCLDVLCCVVLYYVVKVVVVLVGGGGYKVDIFVSEWVCEWVLVVFVVKESICWFLGFFIVCLFVFC